ncbi:hypothetical protein QQ045_002619 [Rhodiola kirilowii]
MQNFTISANLDDLIWLCRHDGILSSKGIKDRISHPQGLDRVLSKIWKHWIPLKISVFIWRLRHRGVPTDDRIINLGISLVSSCRCCHHPFTESIEHLFVLSDFASEVWSLGQSIFGVRHPQTLKQLWLYWIQDGPCKSYIDGLCLIWVCCGIWEIWKA